MKSKYLTIGGLSALSVIIIANYGFADVSSDRLDTYKANKLIPNEVQIATINSVSTDATGVAVFSPDALSWKSYSNTASAALGKYMDWTREDFETFFADSANEAEFEDAWKFLSQIGNDHVQGAAISDGDAMSLLQAEFDKLALECSQGRLSKFPAFPCEGIDFSGTIFRYTDLTALEGLTGEQVASAVNLHSVQLPAVDFTGVDLTGPYFSSVDFSACTGLTAQQILSITDHGPLTLPAIDFSGADFSGKDISTIDFSRCTGLTWEKITAADNFYGVSLPSFDLSSVSLAGMDLSHINFSNCTGLTWDQISSASVIDYVSLPVMDLTNANMTGKDLRGMDFTNCTGLTWDQVISASAYSGILLPSMDLTNADMSGIHLASIDFTRCSGLTGSQLAKAQSLSGIYVTSAQYESMKADLPSGKIIYVDGVFTLTP